MKKLFLLALLCASFQGFGALSPLNQSIREYKALLESPEMNRSLPQTEIIQDIWRVGDTFSLTTKNYTMNVLIRYEQSGEIGPRPFTLEFKKPVKIGE